MPLGQTSLRRVSLREIGPAWLDADYVSLGGTDPGKC